MHTHGKSKCIICYFQNDTRLEFEDYYATINDRISVDSEGSLVIHDVHLEEDNGKYICSAKNQYGIATASKFVTVTKKTQIVSAPQDIPLSVGKSFTFDCEVKVISMFSLYIYMYHNVILQCTILS